MMVLASKFWNHQLVAGPPTGIYILFSALSSLAASATARYILRYSCFLPKKKSSRSGALQTSYHILYLLLQLKSLMWFLINSLNALKSHGGLFLSKVWPKPAGVLNISKITMPPASVIFLIVFS